MSEDMFHRLRFTWLGFVLGAIAAMVVLACFSGWLMRGGFSARSRPSEVEAALAKYALRASVSSAEQSMRNPVQPNAEALAEARDHFADHCAACHANNGSGHTMYGDGLNPAPPDMRLPATQKKSDGELYSIIQNGIRMSGMPAFGQPGNEDRSTWELVLFIRHLPQLSAEEELEMSKANPITPSELKEEQEEDDFLHGTNAEKPTSDKPSKGKSR